MISDAATLNGFINTYNCARRLKTLKGLTPDEYIYKIWTKEPKRGTVNPTLLMSGTKHPCADAISP